MAEGKTTAADLGADVCFADGAGQGPRPPRGRRWAPRGCTPVFRVRGGGRGWVSVAGVLCVRPGARAHLLYRLRLWRGRAGERRGFAWTDYRDLMVWTHLRLGAPLVWVWDNLNVHATGGLRAFIAENERWLRVFRLPCYAPDLNPTEGVWSLLERSVANLAATNLDHLVRVVKRKLKKIQYRSHLLEGCLAETGLALETP